jgi:MFS family permease
LWAFSFFWLGVSAINASLGVLLVAERIKYMVSEEKQGLAIGLIQSLAGLCGGMIYPFVGHLSDRTSSKWGRRSPFMFWGTIATLVSFACTAIGGFKILTILLFFF